MATAGGDVRGRAPQPPETAGAPCRARVTLLWPMAQDCRACLGRGTSSPGGLVVGTTLCGYSGPPPFGCSRVE
ncbi:hypothetical protein NN561_019107 [Cricetulus griseus]